MAAAGISLDLAASTPFRSRFCGLYANAKLTARSASRPDEAIRGSGYRGCRHLIL
jgi:hypothetical protein